MKGIRPDWQDLVHEEIHTHTTSSSGEERDDVFSAVPLLQALTKQDFSALRVKAADGYGILLSQEQVLHAYLTISESGVPLMFLSTDTTRRHWVKQPVSFSFVASEEHFVFCHAASKTPPRRS